MLQLKNNRHEASLQYALSVLTEKYKEYVKSIYLYGSYARKDYNYNSDVDLFVCVTDNISARIIAHMRSDVIPDDYTLPEVELMISTSGLKNPSNQFTTNLRRDAQLLWKAR